MSELTAIPNFISSKRQVTGKDLNDVIAAVRSPPGGTQQIRPTFNRIAIIGDGEAHPAISGLRIKSKLYPFGPNFDTTSTAADTFVDDDISRNKTDGTGALMLDMAQVADRSLGIYIGQVDGKSVYATLRPALPMYVTGSSSIHTNIWKYFGAHGRLEQSPDDDTDPATAHSEASSVPMYNLSEFGNTSSKVYNGEVDIDNQLIGIYAIKTNSVVIAVPCWFPKHGSTAAGECYVFDKPNRANLTCPDNLNRLFTPF